MKKSVYVSLLLLMAASSSAMAQSGPTPQEKMACRSDAGTFCAEFIGKPPQMNACLRENKPKLSEPCRKVVEAHGGASVRPASARFAFTGADRGARPFTGTRAVAAFSRVAVSVGPNYRVDHI